jgi:tryptophanyl-tRNA synthetase
VKLGLFTYPVLQAADILLYRATHVPVGEDQLQHLELARDLCHSFNFHYCTEEANSQIDFFLPPPQPLLSETTRVMSLRDASQKMSKSSGIDDSRILLIDTDEEIREKVKKARTDSYAGLGSVISTENSEPILRPEINNLVNIFSAITNRPIK